MRKGERKLLKDSIIQYVKENTAKISLEELDTVLTAEAIAGFSSKKKYSQLLSESRNWKNIF
jgi:hypothetical protein